MLSAVQPTCFLIADISGYTGYLADVELDHAQDILADLIGAVVSALRPNFRLAKLEGDAAFTYAVIETIDGSMLLDTIERCYFRFRRRRRDVRQATSCECNACSRIPDLNLKFVVYHGTAILQKVAGRQELLGSEGATGGRRGTGSSNHCMHGNVHTVEFEPTAAGTRIHIRFAPPRTAREKALMQYIRPAYQGALESGVPTLIAPLDELFEARDADRGPEPALPMASADGPLACLAATAPA